MECIVLNTSFETIGYIDDYTSFIWTERFAKYSDFELELPAKMYLDVLRKGNYIMYPASSKLMTINTIQISSAFTAPNTIVSGRSLEYLLHKRIIMNEVSFGIGSSVQTGILSLIQSNVISPSDTNRKIPEFSYVSNNDSSVTSVTFSEETKFYRDNLYDAIENLCNEYGLGFKVDFVENKFQFQLYKGHDLSYDQNERNVVVFSPQFGNLNECTYWTSTMDDANQALILGDTITAKKTVTVPVYDSSGNLVENVTVTVPVEIPIEINYGSNLSGLNRAEIFVDSSNRKIPDVPDNAPIDTIMAKANEYMAQLRADGQTALYETYNKDTLDSTVDFYGQFEYRKDFVVGDIVEIISEIGVSMKAQLTEVIETKDANGLHLNPSFETVGSVQI